MSSDPIEVLRELRDANMDEYFYPSRQQRAALDAAIASLSAPKPLTEQGRLVFQARGSYWYVGTTDGVLGGVLHPDDTGFWDRVLIHAATMPALKPESAETVGEVFGPKAVSTMVALERPLPPGTKLYTAPPRPEASAPVGDSLLQTALRNLPQYISKSGLVGPDKHSAMLCFEVLRDALAQQPAPVAPVGVEGRAREAVALALDEAGHHTEADNVRKGIDLDEYREALSIARNALAQQPAAVDEALDRLRGKDHPRLWHADLVGGQISVERMREILTAALANQQQGGGE